MTSFYVKTFNLKNILCVSFAHSFLNEHLLSVLTKLFYFSLKDLANLYVLAANLLFQVKKKKKRVMQTRLLANRQLIKLPCQPKKMLVVLS